MTFSKIQVIKILRDNVPGLGLKEAKDIVDGYELRRFEDRVAGAMGEEAREELRNWALLYNVRKDRVYNDMIPVKEAKASVLIPEDHAGGYGDCHCEDCVRYLEGQ